MTKSSLFTSIAVVVDSPSDRLAAWLLDLEGFLAARFEFYEVLVLFNGVKYDGRDIATFSNMRFIWLRDKGRDHDVYKFLLQQSIGDVVALIPPLVAIPLIDDALQANNEQASSVLITCSRNLFLQAALFSVLLREDALSILMTGSAGDPFLTLLRKFTIPIKFKNAQMPRRSILEIVRELGSRVLLNDRLLISAFFLFSVGFWLESELEKLMLLLGSALLSITFLYRSSRIIHALDGPALFIVQDLYSSKSEFNEVRNVDVVE